jgi:hypothetical protein
VPRAFICFTVLAVFALPCRADGTVPSPETLIELKVMPAPAPRPAFRYLLLPELRAMNPGNPVQSYIKCMMEQQNFFFDKEAFDRRERLLAMPLKELPAQPGLEEYGRSVLSHVDWAARLDNPNWEILLKMRRDGFGTLLPEVQQLRGPARALKVRFRAEIALGRFDDAVRTATTIFAMGRHLGEHPCWIAELVGIAIAFQAIEPLEEMLQQPGCPNLFWALTNLPCPLIPVRKGIEGERMMLHWLFRDLDQSAPMTADQIKSYVEFLDKQNRDVMPDKTKVRVWLDARNEDQDKIEAARRRLVEYGLPEERLLGFPVDQVLLLDEKREMEARFDDFTKTMTLPIWQGEALTARSAGPKEPSLVGDGLTLGTSARRAQGRLDQRIALLRVVEALRLHAAEHNRTLPAKLSEISLPLPDDPLTGKPFRYEFTGAMAHLRGAPTGQEKIAAFNIHYEVIVQNQSK